MPRAISLRVALVAMLGAVALGVLLALGIVRSRNRLGALAGWILLIPLVTPEIVTGVASHVPGGLGVFEATFLTLAPAEKATALAALLLYRLIYYLIPLTVALTVEAVRWAPRIGSAAQISAAGASMQISLCRLAMPTS